jgi:CheY-like chemotaxis protein
MSQLANFNVLILDDNTDFHSVIRNAVYDIGVQNVRSCASISEAQQVMTDGFAPHLILMEINLEGVGGLNFMRQVRAGKMAVVADAPIIIMSEGLKPQTAFSACDVGFEHFLRKPFKADAVQKRVKAVIEKPRRFVVGKAYFGPDRRDKNSGVAYEDEERRGANGKSLAKTAPPRKAVKAPEHFASGAKTSGGSLVDDVPEETKKAQEVDLVEDKAEKFPEAETALNVAAEAKEQLKSAPKPPPVKPLKPKAMVKKAAPPPEKEEIELADAPKERDDGGKPDRAAEIAEKLEAHAIWLTSQAAEGEKARFPDEDLSGADISEANLASANLRNADLQDANLAKTNLFDADLRGANLSGANLSEADLHNAKLRHANLKAAVMPEAGLRGADLAGANLQGAQLAGVDFKDANFLSTNICGADLMGANLTQKQIDKANGDAETKLPPGIRIKVD